VKVPTGTSIPAWSRPAIVLAYTALLLALWRWDGLHTDKEALKYLGCAQQVLQGDLHDLLGNYRHYGVYVLFLLPFVALGMPAAAVIAQAGLSLVAAFALGRTVRRLGGDERAATLAGTLYLVAIPVQQWTLALYTEALFSALAVLLLDRTLGRDRPGPWALVLGILLLFTRPVGLLVVGPLAVRWLTRRRATWTAWAGHLAVLALALLNPGVAAPQLGIIVGSDVLCGCTDHPLAAAGFNGRSVLDTQVHLAGALGIDQLAGLWGGRLLSLAAFTRPHYSLAHNLLVAPWYLLYPFAALGLWRYRRDTWTRTLLGIALVYALLVMFTCDEWSGRFLVPLVGPLLIPATLAIAPARQPSLAE
jgi:hypothetical protein